ncbi:hypothetical protein PPERSA_00376 [Pseudocohnilembus persalinus]|uniref:Uncharacterized protein n=1 Tax=Pseudocohnilembus persalinus TaxID=266149 RepID=A0A0V0QXY7_PSEPJ|nr:hypothetical protein PPERSA_00376 [Pseudocohnilembus persalinus]|eukprot:KRX07219.1 hypothetical protein PPERSA_00376 [Pseudocohnilembus persalinus]
MVCVQINSIKKHSVFTQNNDEKGPKDTINHQENEQLLSVLFAQNPSFEKNACLNTHMTNCVENFLKETENSSSSQRKLIKQIEYLKKAQTSSLLDSQKMYSLNYKLLNSEETKQFWECAQITSENICQEDLKTINFDDYAPLTHQKIQEFQLQLQKNSSNQEKKNLQLEQNFSHQKTGQSSEPENDFWYCLLGQYEACARSNGMKILDYQEFSNFLTKLDLYVQANHPNIEEILEYSAELLQDELPKRDFFSCFALGSVMTCNLLDYMDSSSSDGF